ncbi:MAG: NADH-quinone oxidoreductase subunit M [Pirellulales bacterium]|nr:NADH-quinone oxidoreductase subunit M [Pirellulales bacterium]
MPEAVDLSVPLAISILLPIVGAILVWVVADAGRGAVRQVALWTSLATLAVAGYIVLQQARGAAQFKRAYDWLDTAAGTGVGIQFSLGLDGLSFWLYGLSALLLLVCVLVSWEAIRDHAAGFYSLLLVLGSGMLGVFAARDVILFYVFFEFTLIPLFFLIGIWGSEDRRYAAVKFFLYTLAGSLLTFLGLLAIVLWNYFNSPDRVMTFNIAALTSGLARHPIDAALTWGGMSISVQVLIFLALFAGFAVKVPLFPFHTWLPLAHVQAPTAGSVVLAGILLKIGTYGFLRFSVPMLPDATALFAPAIGWLSAAGVIYAALVALAQSDMKKMIAYSSVGHLGFSMLGLFALNRLGAVGGTLQMVNHGLSTGGLFALIGMLYERYHTRQISAYGGIAKRLPWYAFFFVLFTMSSIGLPMLNGFPGEFMLFMGAFQRGFSGGPWTVETQLRWIAVLSVTGMILNAWYMLWLAKSILYGPLREPHEEHGHSGQAPGPVRDLSGREIAALAPIAVFMLWIGLAPNMFIQPMEPALTPAIAAASAKFDSLWHAAPTATSVARKQAPALAANLKTTKDNDRDR